VDELNLALLSWISLFVIVDPIGLIPSFLAMTEGHSTQEKIQTAKRACIAAFMILLLFFLFGQGVFRVFSITFPAFEIAGGLLLMVVALDMLQARRTGVKESREEQDAGRGKEDIAITPVAIPMLAGPGAITTAILLSRKATSLIDRVILIGDLLLVCAITFLIRRYAVASAKALNVIALRTTTRIMGLILAAIAVQFILDGIGEATHLW